MPSYRRKRYGRRVPDIAATIAREAGKSLYNHQLKTQLDHLATQGLIGHGITDIKAMIDDGTLKRRRIYGRGAYTIPGVMKSLASAGNAYASGGLTGLAGNVAHQAVSSGHHTPMHRPSIYDWTGSGAYGSANQLVNASHPSSVFASAIGETNDVVIHHREYIMDITPNSSGFQTQYTAYQNPGLAASFPWLSQIAQYFEEYEFEQLLYTVESMVTEGNTNASGTVIMCTQYNPTNAPFTNKAAMENYEHSQSFKVTEHAVHGVECDPAKRSGNPSEYIRVGPVPSGQDPKTYDLGIFQVATQGAFPNLNIGELWVTYKVRLSKAKIPPVGAQPTLPVLNMTCGQYGAYGYATIDDPMGILVFGGTPNEFYAVNGNTGTQFMEHYDTSNKDNLQQTGFQLAFQDEVAVDGRKSNVLSFPVQVEVGNYRVRLMGHTDSGKFHGVNWLGTNATVVKFYNSFYEDGTYWGATANVQINAPGNISALIYFNIQADASAINNVNLTVEQLASDYPLDFY